MSDTHKEGDTPYFSQESSIYKTLYPSDNSVDVTMSRNDLSQKLLEAEDDAGLQSSVSGLLGTIKPSTMRQEHEGPEPSSEKEEEEGLTQRSWEQENLLEEIRKSRQDHSRAFEMVQPITCLNWPTPGLGAIGCSAALGSENTLESRRNDVRDSLGEEGNRQARRDSLGDEDIHQMRRDTSSEVADRLSTVRYHLGEMPTNLDNASKALIQRMRSESKNQTCLDHARDSFVATRAGSDFSDRTKTEYQWPTSIPQMQTGFGHVGSMQPG